MNLNSQVLAMEKGVTLVETMIALALIALALVALSSLSVTQKGQEQKLDRRTQVEEILADIGFRIQTMDYGYLQQFCQSQNAMDTPVTGQCVENNVLRTSAPSSTTDPILSLLNFRRDWAGFPKTDGDVCVEFTECFSHSVDSVLDLQLTAIWHDPGRFQDPTKLFKNALLIRRARW